MLNIDHDRDRRLSTILKKNFSHFEAKLGKRIEMQTQRPVENAAAVEIEIGGLRQLFLDDFHKLLGKQKSLSTLTTGPEAIHNVETMKLETKTRLPDLAMRE